MTVIKLCDGCKPHPYQDRKYGKGVRVHNTGKAKAVGATAFICTVCSKRTEK